MGASELFYIKKGIAEPKILMVNYYNCSKDEPVVAKLLVAKDIVCQAELHITEKQSIIGLITNVDGENRVYFGNISLGNSVTSRVNSHEATHSRKYLYDSMVGSLDFRQIVEQAGGIFVEEKPKADKDCLDLSLEALQKSTIIGLMSGTLPNAI